MNRTHPICVRLLRNALFLLPALLPSAQRAPAADTSADTVIDGKRVSEAISGSLGDPHRFNWELVALDAFRVESGDLRLELDQESENPVARVRSSQPIVIHATGHGGGNGRLDLEFDLEALDAPISLARKRATVAANVRVINHEPCAIWTRARSQKTTPFGGRITFRATAIAQKFDVQLRLTFELLLKEDGSVVLVPRTWRPTNPKDQIHIQISGHKLPDGTAIIQPLDAETVRVNMHLPFSIGDRTIRNPLRDAIANIVNREIVLGRLFP